MNIKLLFLLFLSLFMFACSEQVEVGGAVAEDQSNTLYHQQLKALEKAKGTEKLLLDAAEKRGQQIQQEGG